MRHGVLFVGLYFPECAGVACRYKYRIVAEAEVAARRKYKIAMDRTFKNFFMSVWPGEA